MRKMPFVQSCVLCGDHQRFMHDPHLTACPTCGAPYCRACYNSLPKVKVGLLKVQPQCPRCAQASQAARAPYAPYQPMPPPMPPPAPVYLPPQQVREKEVITREIVKVRCRFCGHPNQEGTGFCEACGAPQR